LRVKIKWKRLSNVRHPSNEAIVVLYKNGQDGLKTTFLAVKKLPPRGVEPLGSNSQSTTNKALTENENPVLDTGLDSLVQEFPDLVEVVKAWPDLPERTRTAIKALIETHKAEKE